MPRTVSYTIAFDNGDQIVDLCKIIFGGDGSYYVTAPYHPLNRAIAARKTVNYADESAPALADSIGEASDVATLEDNENRLKVSHHPDGFLQFSGRGILSGRDEDGNPRGLGVFSWPLHLPTFGPSFGLMFSDPVMCGRPSNPSQRTITFHEADIRHMRAGTVRGLRIAGFYFPVHWREFVYRASDDSWWIDIVQPNAQAVKRLRVVLSSTDCDYPGFIGLEALPHGLEGDDDQPRFFMATSTGSLRRNDDGDLIGDQLVCLYPVPGEHDTASFPTLDFSLPAPPYTAPPGTTDLFPPGDPYASEDAGSAHVAEMGGQAEHQDGGHGGQ